MIDRSRRWPVALGLAAASVLAVGLRAIRFRQVFADGEVEFPSFADELYHLRRIVYSVENFPAVLDFDYYVNFPHGARIVWPAMFDWSVAAAARLFVGSGDPLAVERFVVWVPPLLGGLTVFLVGLLAWRLGGALAALLAASLLAVLPAHWSNTQLGAVDHHVAVALGVVLLLGLGIRLLDTPSGGALRARAAWLGLAMAGLLLLWPGGLLHVVVVQAVCVVWMLAASSQALAVSRARALAIGHATAAALLAPAGFGEDWEVFGAWTPLVLSNLQPAWFLGGALALGAVGLLWSRPVFEGRPARLVSAAAVGLAGPLLALLLVPELRDSLLYSAGWFSKEEDFQLHVAELRPLFYYGGKLDLGLPRTSFSDLFYLFPLAWILLAWRMRERTAPAGMALVLTWSLVFLVATVFQVRFSTSFSVGYAIVLGVAGASLWELLAGTALHESGRARRVALGLLAFALLLAALLPVELSYRANVRSALGVFSGQPTRLKPMEIRRRLVRRAALWLRDESPPTGGYLEAGVVPEYAVLSAWGLGHGIRYRSERPMIQDNFGVYGGPGNFQRAWDYYGEQDEERAVDILSELGVRYVVADGFGAGSSRRYGPRAMARRLARGGLRVHRASQSEGGVVVPALTRHRLIYRSLPGTPVVGDEPYLLSIYEPVPGARVSGRARPGEPVEARLGMSFHQDRTNLYRARTRADETGRYEIVLPYPNDVPFSSAVSVDPAYELRGGCAMGLLELAEQAVRGGARVEGPDLTEGETCP